MSSVNKNMLVALLLVTGLLVLAGCGSEKNDKNVFDGDQHPAGWLITGHPAAAQADASVCQQCHGSDFSGGVSRVACASCHVNGSPLTLTGCTSCHGKPPTGTTAPNRAGAHNTATGHFAAQVTLPDGCNTCHNGAGSGTVLHDNGVADVQFLSAYNAKSGTAVYNADGTCSNVSCHGGQTTPVWLSGSINVATQCTSCHSFGTTEYNSFVSGQHYEHVIVQNINCNFCHDFTKLMQNHFTSLNTSTLEGPASATIQDYVNYNPGPPYPTCTPSCHVTRVW